ITNCGSGPNITQIAYTQVAPVDPIVHAGMPASFTFPLDNYAGSCFSAASGARTFYEADTRQSGGLVPPLVGLVLAGGGRTISFAVIIGLLELQSDDFKRLFVNAIEWAASGVTSSLVSLITSPGNLSFNYQAGSVAPPSQLITVSSSGSAVNFTASGSPSSARGRLSVSPARRSPP